MPLIRQTIPNLVGGVSQQPDAMRLEGQCTEQINAYSDPTNGLRKRNRIDFLRKHDINVTTDDCCTFISRDQTEKYVAVTSDNKLRIFNLENGNEAAIIDSSGTSHANGLAISGGDYLDSSNYKKKLKFLSVGDTTYIVNKQQKVTLESDRTPQVSDTALLFVKQGAAKTNYDVKIKHNQTGTVPVQAAINLTYTVYDAWLDGYTYYQFWRLSGATVHTAGSGYKNQTVRINALDVSLRVASNSVLDLTFSNGSLSSIKIVEAGEIAAPFGMFNPQHTLSNFKATVPAPNDPNFNGQDIDIRMTSGSSDSTMSNTYSPNISDSTTRRIAERLYQKLVADAAIDGNNSITNTEFFRAELHENLIELEVTASSTNMSYEISVSDGLGNNGLGLIYKEVNSITDLPLYCKNGFTVKVLGGDDTADDYYVEFVTRNGEAYGNGHWKETVGFDITKGIDPDSFVHQLLLTAEDEFTFGPLNLAERLVGDETTNPLPSFCGKRINNVFFYRNRLGVLADDKVILSESGLGLKTDSKIITYNFFRTTVQTLLDSDPIDVTVATDKITNLRSAIPFQDNLILFSDNTQFSLDTGGQLLSPTSVSISPLTEFDADSSINPQVVGDSVYFPVDKAEYLELREYIINKNTESYESFTLTNAVPTYIPAGIKSITYSTTQSCVALTSGTDARTIYIYKFLNISGKKIQNSWSKFTVPFPIHGLNFEKDVLTIMMVGTNALMQTSITFSTELLESTDVYPSSSGDRSQILVDMAFEATMGGSGGSTAVPIPFPTDTLTLASDGSDWERTDGSYHSITGYDSVANTINFSHIDNSAAKFTVGLKYNMVYEFSEFVIKQKDQKFQTAINIDHKLKNMSLYYTNAKGPTSGDIGPRFELKVKSPILSLDQGNPHTTTFGLDEYRGFELEDGFFTVSLFCGAEDVEITLEQPYKYQVNFQNVNVESIVRDRATPY